MSKSTTGRALVARLRDLRKQQGLTQERFAELAGIGYKYYQLLELGKRIDFRLSTLEKLAKAHGIQVHELLGPTTPKVRGQAKKRRA